MGLGILEPRGSSNVPGTSLLREREEKNPSRPNDSSTSINPNLKYDRSSGVPVLLVPQPSDDPNDPLNLPLWRRDVHICILSLFAVLATTLSPILAANSLTVAFFFGLDFTKIALLTGWHLLAVGLAGIFFVPSARVWGKRHLYLLGAALVCASCAWAGAVGHSYGSLVWARVVQGIGLAPFEALVNASVGDLFFVHERGKRMALSNLALFGGAFFTPVIAGVITTRLGWQWTFNLVAIFSGALFPLVFLLVPETAFRRDQIAAPSAGYENAHTSTTVAQTRSSTDHLSPSHEQKPSEASSGSPSSPTTTTQNGDVPPSFPKQSSKSSYLHSLAPFSGRKTDDAFLPLLLRPFPLIFHPGILWAALIQSTLIGWTVLIGIVLAAIFLSPPLFFTPEQVGYMYTGAFVGALIGFLICGLLADWSAKVLTRANGGVYEPEFRCVLVIPQLILGCMGLYGFGITSNDPGTYGWAPSAVFFGAEVAGMVCGAVASALYITDAHADIAIEAFTVVLIAKNIFSFGLTYHGYDWIVAQGVRRIFVIVASAQVGVCALTLPMYLFGKLNRAFFARHDVLGLLKLK